jgi:hypothetical protein
MSLTPFSCIPTDSWHSHGSKIDATLLNESQPRRTKMSIKKLITGGQLFGLWEDGMDKSSSQLTDGQSVWPQSYILPEPTQPTL